jgi:nicotinamidase-related amidase
MRWSFAALLVTLSGSSLLADTPSKGLSLTLRSRTQPFKGVDEWKEVTFAENVEPKETAIVICDMWDKHWCPSATRRCGEIAVKMNEVVKAARARRVLIVHAPSDCMGYYKDSPARKRLLDVKKVPVPKAVELPDPPCPVDASDGGCDDDPAPKQYRAWSRQHPAIVIDEERDGISDNGQEVYSFLKERGIKNILMMGVHTNMCVLHRTFAIKPMTRAGMRCVLVRDLTDAMYNPRSKPFVSHAEGTERIIQFIEKYWCPSCLSADLLK